MILVGLAFDSAARTDVHEFLALNAMKYWFRIMPRV